MGVTVPRPAGSNKTWRTDRSICIMFVEKNVQFQKKQHLKHQRTISLSWVVRDLSAAISRLKVYIWSEVTITIYSNFRC